MSVKCEYCLKEFTAIEWNIYESQVCSGYPASHCEMEKKAQDDEHKEFMKKIHANYDKERQYQHERDLEMIRCNRGIWKD